MFTSVVVTLAFVCGALSAPTKCPGGSNEGENVERGRFFYLCHEGQLIMKGCLNDAKAHMNEHDTFKKDGYLFECVSSGTEFVIKYKGCVSEKGEEVLPNGSWQDENYWYACSSDGDRFKAEVKGCVDNGKRYNVGESVNKGDLIYECAHNANGNTGFDIYPNHDIKGATFGPDQNHVQPLQFVPNHN